MANKSSNDAEVSAFHRAISPLAFVFALLMLIVICYDSGFTSLPPTEKRYVAAKARVAALKDTPQKSTQREPWEKLASEFRSIYDSDPSWPNRPAALFKSAESLEELASRSCSKADAKKAIACYETVALRHASSRLADDALFRAARLRAAVLKDDKGALSLLTRLKQQYPKGDMIKEATALENALIAAAKGKAAPEAIKAVTATSKDILDDMSLSGSVNKINSKASFAGDLPLRYKAALSKISALKADTLRACWRQPWESLRDEFIYISQKGKNRLAPQALYQAAVCQEAIANCSRLSKDSKKSVDMYLDMAKKFPKHADADNAILHAAKLQRNSRETRKRAVTTLDKLLAAYPKSDSFKEASKLCAKWKTEDTPVATTLIKNENKFELIPELQVLSWDSPSRNKVEIILEMSAPVKYSAKLTEAANGLPARLSVDLENATVINDVRKGVTVQGSLLQAVRVRDLKKGGATIQFDFRDVRKFDVRSEDNSCRIIVDVAAGTAKLQKDNAKIAVASAKKVNAINVSHMASQLGLTVHRIFIDAGHGGKDPGTNHNNILERTITLDVASRLGRLLKANGLEVIYSRDKDKTIPLSQRTKLANASKADLFISIHINAHENHLINGFETYFLNLASNKQAARVAMLENAGSDKRVADMQGVLTEIMLNAKIDESQRLATDIQKSSLLRLKKRNYSPKDNGVKSAPFHVLAGAQMPAVLVELGYCTNNEEAHNLASPKYRHALAEGLAEGILNFKNRLIHNRTADNLLTKESLDAM